MSSEARVIAIIEATGHVGSAIARRLVRNGVRVVLGLRDAARSQAAAEALSSSTGQRVASGSNA